MTHSSSPQPSPDAKNLDSEESAAEPTLLEQMGGLSGLVSATLPVIVLIPVNNFFGLGPALAAALGVAVGHAAPAFACLMVCVVLRLTGDRRA